MLCGEVAVIIVNYGTAAMACNAADSVLARQHGGRRVEVHVVDNASPGDDAKLLQDWHAASSDKGRITLHLEAENHGFGRGNNLVLRQLAKRNTPPCWVMFLNPDAALENEAIDILVRALETREDAVMAGAGICKPDGTPVTAAFRFPSASSEFASAVGFGPVSRLFHRSEVPLPPDHLAGPVDWVSGAAAVAQFEFLVAQDFFDPDFFLYYEEVEMMHRLHKAGGKILYVPQARVIHEEGVATGVKSGRVERKRLPEYWYDSWQLYFRKTQGVGAARRVALARLMGACLGYPIAWLRGRAPSLPAQFLGDFGRLALRPLFAQADCLGPGENRGR